MTLLREQIEQELRSDPTRSNREIARLLGVDHKTVGNMRRKANGSIAISPNGELGRSPKPVGEIVGKSPNGEIPHGGEIERKANGKLDWGDVPDTALMIPPQGMTAAWIDEQTGELVIMQDQTHLWADDAVIRVSASEVEAFVQGLVDMVRDANGS